MARASRSSKKQPDFDPSEIEDLIFSPAVGRGVGSHLVGPGPMTTVAMSPLTTGAAPPLDTVAAGDLSTVCEAPTFPDYSSTPDVPIVAISPQTPVITTPNIEATTVVTSIRQNSATPELWITDHGDLVSAARVKRIRLAQDVINSAEESVYDTLWNARLISSDESSRLVQAGYDYLVKRTRLSRKTIQRIVAKLLEKDFIEVDTRADIYQRTATVYRVFSYKAVLERNTKKGRLHVAKMGPGFAYARPLQGREMPPGTERDQPTIATSNVAPVANESMATVARPATVAVVKNDRTTVVKMSPYLLDARTLDNPSSAAPEVIATLAEYGSVDDDVAAKLVAACRSYAADCTNDEISHFIREKGRLVNVRDSRVQNPLGFLLTAVPKCFSGQPLMEYRAARSREAVRQSAIATSRPIPEDPALVRWRRDQEAALSDPNVSEQEKHLIRLCLGLNAPSQ